MSGGFGAAQAGGNTIAFAKSCGFVIACEIDPMRTEMAKANSAVYGEPQPQFPPEQKNNHLITLQCFTEVERCTQISPAVAELFGL